MNDVVPVPGPHRPDVLVVTSDTPAKTWKLREVASICRVTVRTIQNWMRLGMIPSPVRIGYATRFTEVQVAVILQGASLPETYVPSIPPRQKVGSKGGKATAKKFKGKHPSTKTKAVATAFTKRQPRSRSKLVKNGKGKP